MTSIQKIGNRNNADICLEQPSFGETLHIFLKKLGGFWLKKKCRWTIELIVSDRFCNDALLKKDNNTSENNQDSTCLHIFWKAPETSNKATMLCQKSSLVMRRLSLVF